MVSAALSERAMSREPLISDKQGFERLGKRHPPQAPDEINSLTSTTCSIHSFGLLAAAASRSRMISLMT